MKTTNLLALLALLATAALAAPAAAQATQAERVAQVRAQYAVDGWSLGAARDGLPLGSLALDGLRGGPVRPKGGVVTRSFAPADAPDDAGAALLVEVAVADSAEAATDRLVTWLAGLAAPRPAAADTAYGVDLGQAGFVGPSGAGPRAYSWTAFVRGNVAVRLWNVDATAYPELDLPRLAAAIDAELAAREPLAAGAEVPRPRVTRLAAADGAIVAGTPVALDVAVVDPRGGEATLAWNVGGEGQGYVERREDGWYLFPTGPGAATVTLTAVGSTATVATRTLDVAIADD